MEEDGQIFLSLKNVYNFFAFIYMIGHFNVNNEEIATNYTMEQFIKKVTEQGLKIRYIQSITYEEGKVAQSDVKAVGEMLLTLKQGQENAALGRLLSDRHAFVITK